MITARAIGVLEELALNPDHGAARGLSTVLGEGRDAIQTAINELRDLGYVETISYGRGLKVLRVSSTGFQFLESRTSILLSRLNSNINIYAYLADKQERVLDGVEYKNKIELNIGGEVSFLGQMDSDPNEVAERVRKDREKRQAEYLANKNKIASERITAKQSKTPFDWTPTDVSYEFASRVQSLWHVKPWSVAKTRFKIALTNARKEHGTNGEIENKMMDLYFMQISHETHLIEPEIIWKRFIMQFSNLSVEAKRSMVTKEQIEIIEEESQSGREWLRNV